MKRRGIVVAFLVAMILPIAAPAAAQLAAGADLVLQSRYVWRGLTRVSGPVLQPAAFLAWQPDGHTVTMGAWMSFEARRPGDRDLTDAGAQRIAEVDLWFEGHTRIGRLDLRAGVIRYDFVSSHEQALGDRWDTTELYAAVEWLASRLVRVGGSFSWDVRAVRGGYATLDAVGHLPIAALGELLISAQGSAQAGISLGQESSEGRLGHFEERGLTHIVLGLALRAHNRRIAPFLSGYAQFNDDSEVRRTRADDDEWIRFWVGAGLSILVGPSAREQR